MRTRHAVTLLIVTTALATPAAAAAVREPTPGPYHGGGLPETGPVLSYLRLAANGRTFEAALTLRATCDAYPVPLQARVAVTDGRLEEDGTATVVRRIEGDVTGPDGRPAREDGESTVTVRFLPGGRASGTVRLASTFTDAESGQEVARCDTGTLSFRNRIIPRVRPRGTPRIAREGTVLVGVAGVQPIVTRVGEDGDLDGLAFVYRSACQPRSDGRGTRRVVFVPEFRVRQDGSFHVRATQQLFTPGGVEQVRIDLRGRYVAGGAILGSVRLRGELTRDDGEAVLTCDSKRMPVLALPSTGALRAPRGDTPRE